MHVNCIFMTKETGGAEKEQRLGPNGQHDRNALSHNLICEEVFYFDCIMLEPF